MNSEKNEDISEENKKNLDNRNNNNESNVENNNKEIVINNEDNSKTNPYKEIVLLNKNTKLDNYQIYEKTDNNKINKSENEIPKKEEYEYGYSVKLLEEQEKGLMEDFLKDESISDFYNYNYNEETFQKIVKQSILIRYERHLKEEMEKRKKMQNMFMLNMNINMNMNNNIFPSSMLPQMNSLMIANMNNNNNLNYPIQIPSLQNINKK